MNVDIGIVHYLLFIIVDNDPSQVSVIVLKVPSWALNDILYSVTEYPPSSLVGVHDTTTLVPVFEDVAYESLTGTE